MPTSKYDKHKSQFDEACRTKTIPQFIQTLESKNQNSYIVHFFLGCAYEELGDSDKAYRYYLLTVKQANRDKSTVQIVKAIYEFVKKTGRKDLTEIIAQRRLPGVVISQPKKQSPQKTTANTSAPVKPVNPPQVKPSASKQPKPKVQPTETPTAKAPASKQPKPKVQPTETPTAKTPVSKQPKPKAQPTETPTAKTPASKQPKPKVQPTETPTAKTPASKQPKPKAQPAIPTPLTPEQAFVEAKTAIINKNIDLAMQHFEYAYVGGLRSVQFLYMLAQTFQRLKRYDEAIIYLDMGLSLYPDVDNQVLFMNLLAQIYSSQKKRSEALNSYSELVKLYTQKGNSDKKRFALI
ncbi:MAG TPA: hypothetical protein PLZ51_00240, partial [Aggregatilineales bacterium]|nr:hypothetical protein [Aggregatilineales bacterium]